MQLSINDIIKEISIQNNVAIGKSDPILIVFTAQKMFLEELQKSLNETIQNTKQDIYTNIFDSMETLQNLSREHVISVSCDAKQLASEIVSKTLEETEKQYQKTLDQNIEILSKSFRDASIILSKSLDDKINETKHTSYINIISSCLVLLAVIILIIFKI